MDRLQLQRHRRRFAGLLWPMRFTVLGGTFIVWYELVAPATATIPALAIGAAFAAAAILLEVYLTALLRHSSFRNIAVWRILIADRLLSNPGEAFVDQPRPQMPGSTRGRAPQQLPGGEEYVEGEAWDDDETGDAHLD